MNETRQRRMARAKTHEAAQALQEAAKNRKGWQFDPRTGDAHLIMSVLGARESSMGCIAYVRANPHGSGYESIVKAPNGYAQWPGEHTDAKEALVLVERWLQKNLLGIAASDAKSEVIEDLRTFLISHMGEEEGLVVWTTYLAHLAKGK